MKRIYSLLLIIPLMLACGKSGQKEAAVQTETAIPVRIGHVHEKSVVSRFRVTGEVAPMWKLDVMSDAAGKIIEKRAVLGDRVKKEQLLARLLQDVPGMEYAPVAIDAPAGGVIVADMIEVGAMVTPQRPIYTLARLDSVLVIARLLESDWSKLRAGSRCSIAVDALPGRTFAGRVRKLLPQVDARTHTGAAEIVTANGDLALRPGMSVECEFVTGTRTTLVLPLDALVRSGAGYWAAKIVDGRAKFTALSAGEIVDQEIVVSGDIRLGDAVVVYGQNLLQDGSAVKIVD
jgi:multidrug efflux pump subunit AcrA (membrane-fusion protein)